MAVGLRRLYLTTVRSELISGSCCGTLPGYADIAGVTGGITGSHNHPDRCSRHNALRRFKPSQQLAGFFERYGRTEQETELNR
jgi:hypothetical protein